MNNKDKYHFADFTTTHYAHLLDLTLSLYPARLFTNFNKKERFVIIRHDVDFSMHRAQQLAEIESEKGIKSTFFLLLHCEFYNLFEKEIVNSVNRIIECGHSIGLHFDSHFYPVQNIKQLEKYLIFEKQILENIFTVNIEVFSFHITNSFTLSCNKEMYGGMINAYSDYFQKEIGYCSDSNGYWRYKRMEDVVLSNEYERLQLLTHPVWWSDGIMSPKERLWNCIDERAEKCKSWYTNIAHGNNRKIIDW